MTRKMKLKISSFHHTTVSSTLTRAIRAARHTVMPIFTLSAFALPLMTFAAQPVLAQNLFAPVAQVNDSVVTGYELDQRQKLLTVLGGAPSRADALEALIGAVFVDGGYEKTRLFVINNFLIRYPKCLNHLHQKLTGACLYQLQCF